MSTNTEFPSMNVGTLSINTFNNGLTIMDRNTFPVSVFLKTDVSISRMVLNGDLIINGDLLLNGGLTISKLVMADQQYETPVNAATVTADPTKTILIIDPAGPLATLTIDMPANPPDGAIIQIGITRDIGAINHTAPGGATIDFPLISAVAPSTQHYYYRVTDNTWYIIVAAEGPSSVTLTCIQDQTPNPNVQLCTSATALQGFFNNSTDKYLDIPLTGDNVFIGFHAGNTIGAGINNIGIGLNTLELVTTGNNNIAIGINAMRLNVLATLNIAIGPEALENTTGGTNVSIGRRSLNANLTGDGNTALGTQSLENSLGDQNTAVGHTSMQSNTTGNNNTAFGSNTLAQSTTGDNNTAVGPFALAAVVSSSDNTAVGHFALGSNFGVSFDQMVAVGARALAANAASTECTAVGYNTLAANTTGTENTAVGYLSLNVVTTGDDNTALGHSTLALNTASLNTAIGSQSLSVNTTGSENTALGFATLANNTTGDSNTAVGYESLNSNITGTGNIALGESAGIDLLLDDNIAIGNIGLGADTGIVRIGTAGTHTDTFIPTNLHVGVTGAPGSGYIGLLNEYADVSGPYGDAAVIPDPTIAFGGPAISVWLIPLSAAAMATGLTVTMPAPVSLGQTMHISFVGVAGPPAVVGTGIIYTPAVDAAHTADVTAIITGANAFASSWYVSPASGLWTRI